MAALSLFYVSSEAFQTDGLSSDALLDRDGEAVFAEHPKASSESPQLVSEHAAPSKLRGTQL